jgi:hypothetical protein
MRGAVCGAQFWDWAAGTRRWRDSWVARPILKKFFAPAALSGCSCPRKKYSDCSLRVINLNKLISLIHWVTAVILFWFLLAIPDFFPC